MSERQGTMPVAGAEPPARPAIPVTLYSLVATIACERAVLGAGLSVGVLAAHLAPASALVALALGALCARSAARRAVPIVCVVVTAAATSCLLAGLAVMRMDALAEAFASEPVSGWEFELRGDMSEGTSGWRGRARAVWEGACAGDVYLVADECLPAGSRVTCVGRFSANADDDWGRSCRMQGIAGTVSVTRVTATEAPGGMRGAILRLREAVLESLDACSSDARAVLAGGVCGYRRGIYERGLDGLFSTSGASHLVAVSGSHLSLVASLLGGLLERRRFGPRARCAVLLALTGAFVIFCGAPVSACRAWAMSGIAAASQLVGRRSHTLSSVCVVALVMALASPGVTGQLGYLLSVVSVCGLAAFGAYGRYALGVVAPPPRWARHLPVAISGPLCSAWRDARGALAASLVCQLCTMPITCASFSRLSLVGPVANVLLGPLFTAMMALGLISALLVGVPWLQGPVLLLASLIAGAFVRVLRAFAAVPLAAVAVDVGAGPLLLAALSFALVLLLWWPRLTRARMLVATCVVAACALAFVLRWRYFAPARVRVLDVGQGDAILVTDGSAAVLVDTGPDESVARALARSHVWHLDAIVITHLHDDHYGGVGELVGLVTCERVIVAEGVADELEGELASAVEELVGDEVVEVGYGDALLVGGFELMVVSPVGEVDGADNEDSLELVLSYGEGGRSLVGLLTGDAESDQTAACVERGDVGDVDFLKVGHHGSAASLTEELALALDPEVSVASAGEGNSYGHPTQECVDVLSATGSTFLCTMDVGDVTILPGADGPMVRCQRRE